MMQTLQELSDTREYTSERIVTSHITLLKMGATKAP